MHDNASFVTMLEQPSMFVRLFHELREAWRELRDNPRAYITSTFKWDAGGSRRKNLLRVGLAIGVIVYAMGFVAILLFWSLAHNRTFSADHGKPRVVINLPRYWPKAEMPEGDDGLGGGGGGGGHQRDTPASKGDTPAFLMSPIVGPTPEPQLKPPALPVFEAVLGDPQIQLKREDLSVTGSADGVIGPPSAGPGLDGGIGTGSHGGIGPDNGPGVGPGGEGGTGGGIFHLGPPRRPALQQAMVDARPMLLNEPRPLYTEDARKNKVQGVVRVRVFVDESGSVKEVVVARGLPDGLNEQAIRAAYQMRFRPAMKNGRPVSYWLSNVEIEFNLR